jgi:hypothetical protein
MRLTALGLSVESTTTQVAITRVIASSIFSHVNTVLFYSTEFADSQVLVLFYSTVANTQNDRAIGSCLLIM